MPGGLFERFINALTVSSLVHVLGNINTNPTTSVTLIIIITIIIIIIISTINLT